MAEAPAIAPPTSRLAAQEATRRELERARRPAGPAASPGAPAEIDRRAFNVPFVGRAALNLQQQGLPRGGESEGEAGAGGSAAVDQALGREAIDQRSASLFSRARSALTQRSGAKGGGPLEDAGGGAQGGGAKAGSLAGALGGGQGGGNPAQKLEELGQRLGSGILKGLWEALIPSFGLTILVIDLIFFIGWASKFFRKWIPEVGHEWIPPNVRKNIPKNFLLPLKYAELTAMVVVTFLIGMALLIALMQIIFMITLVMAVAGA